MKTTLAVGMLAGLLATGAMGEDGQPQDGARERAPRGGDGRPAHGGPDEMFRRMDKDGDGRVSKREFFGSPRVSQLTEDKREAIFTRLDRDGDGFLTRREIRAMRHNAEHRVREGFHKLDTDDSGGLSYEEFGKGEFAAKLPEEKRRQIFDRMDSDGDGEITPEDRPKAPPHGRRGEGRKKSQD